MDNRERVHLVVNEEKQIPFDVSEAGPGMWLCLQACFFLPADVYFFVSLSCVKDVFIYCCSAVCFKKRRNLVLCCSLLCIICLGFVCMCLCTLAHVCVHVCVHVCASMHMQAHTSVCIHV